MPSPEAVVATLLVAKAASDHYHMLLAGDKKPKDRKTAPNPEVARRKLFALFEEIKEAEATTVDELFDMSRRAASALKDVLDAQADGKNRLPFSHPVGQDGSHDVALEISGGNLFAESNYSVGNNPAGRAANSRVHVGFRMSENGDQLSVIKARIHTHGLKRRPYEVRSTDTDNRFVGRIGHAVKWVVEDTLEFL